jgi:hypothetical protein
MALNYRLIVFFLAGGLLGGWGQTRRSNVVTYTQEVGQNVPSFLSKLPRFSEIQIAGLDYFT